jgi:putative copper resistance protein D
MTTWRADPLALASAAIAAWAYARGVRRLRAGGDPWPSSRTLAFGAGLALALGALVSPIEAYAERLLSMHMVQHLLLGIVAVPLLALGAPVSLALRAAGPGARRALSRFLRHRAVRTLVHPVVGWAAFVGVTYAIHFTGLYQAALEHTWVHVLEHALVVGSAVLFWWPIVGADPLPHRLPHPARMLSLFLAMPAMSFAALAIHSADAVLYRWYATLPGPWGPRALGDQRTAAVVMWLAGNLLFVIAMLLVAADWKRVEDARQRRLEARVAARG